MGSMLSGSTCVPCATLTRRCALRGAAPTHDHARAHKMQTSQYHDISLKSVAGGLAAVRRVVNVHAARTALEQPRNRSSSKSASPCSRSTCSHTVQRSVTKLSLLVREHDCVCARSLVQTASVLLHSRSRPVARGLDPTVSPPAKTCSTQMKLI